MNYLDRNCIPSMVICKTIVFYFTLSASDETLRGHNFDSDLCIHENNNFVCLVFSHLRTNLPDHRVTRPASPPHLQNLPQQTANPSISSAGHPHHSATTGNYLQTGQIFGQSSMYPQELMSHSGLPYAAHYGTMPSGAPILFDSRLMQDYAAGIINNN